jgi:hypothetical protein
MRRRAAFVHRLFVTADWKFNRWSIRTNRNAIAMPIATIKSLADGEVRANSEKSLGRDNGGRPPFDFSGKITLKTKKSGL